MDDYKFKTLDEAREVIIDTDLNLEIARATNRSAISQLFRIIRTAGLWISLLLIIFTGIKYGDISTISKIIIGLIGLYIFAALIVSWSWFNEDNDYKQIKLNMVNYVLNNCKEWVEPERKPEEWEYKQIYNNMLRLVSLKVDDNKQ